MLGLDIAPSPEVEDALFGPDPLGAGYHTPFVSRCHELVREGRFGRLAFERGPGEGILRYMWRVLRPVVPTMAVIHNIIRVTRVVPHAFSGDPFLSYVNMAILFHVVATVRYVMFLASGGCTRIRALRLTESKNRDLGCSGTYGASCLALVLQFGSTIGYILFYTRARLYVAVPLGVRSIEWWSIGTGRTWVTVFLVCLNALATGMFVLPAAAAWGTMWDLAALAPTSTALVSYCVWRSTWAVILDVPVIVYGNYAFATFRGVSDDYDKFAWGYIAIVVILAGVHSAATLIPTAVCLTRSPTKYSMRRRALATTPHDVP
jgi:hypothetical protein